MNWIKPKKDWIPHQKSPTKKFLVEKAYSITQVAEMLAVSRRTIFKWLSIDEPEYAVIPPDAWFRLPSGHIRIREWVVIKIKRGEI